ncbi:MAG: extracellular solute-binding protein [Actinomycetota bacterium]|nr:extracellular solute-binding protein [Actinomycetota bacterium]
MNPPLDPDSAVPLYYQLKRQLMDEIVAGIYHPGDRLPTEHELCQRHGISRTPVRKALTELADEGVIVRIRRRGTFVSRDWRPTHLGRHPLRIVVSDPIRAARISNVLPKGATVSVVDYTELRSCLMKAVAEGTAPDIALIDEVWIAELANAHVIHALDQLNPAWSESDYQVDFDPSFVDGVRFDEHVYAVPEEINVAGIWYNRDLLARAGADLPSSWDELRSLAVRLQGLLPTGSHAVVMPGGIAAAETTTYCLTALLASNGVQVINDGVTLDTGEAVEALRLLRHFIEDGTMSGDVVAFDWLTAPRLVGSGGAAIGIGGSYEAEVIAEMAGLTLDNVLDHFVFAPFPAGPHGAPATAAGAMAYAVLRQSRDPMAAMRLLVDLTDPEQLVARTSGRPMIPARRSSIDLVREEQSFVFETAKLFSTAVTRPQIVGYPLVSIQLQHMVEAVITGSLRPAAAVERTADIIGAITGRSVVH